MATETKKSAITYTDRGQPYPYADSVFAGTVEAETEAEARAILANMRFVESLPDRVDAENWHMPYLERFKLVREGVWHFRVIERYAG